MSGQITAIADTVPKLTVSARPGPGWDDFVQARPQASVYQLSGWSLLAGEVFGHRTYFVEARDTAGTLAGVLPLVRQRSLLFGDFMTSVPFFNYGGALADTEPVTLALMERARALAESEGCRYLELRDVEQRAVDWRVRTDKASMILELPSDATALSKQLGSKLRSQVKRADRESPTVRVGGRDLIGAFYEVFCHNMRELGTPVYPRRFFEAIVERYPAECLLIVVDRAGKPAAAGFLVISKAQAEIPWAACRADARPAGFNMKLYWEALAAVVERGCTQFDFGRSTIDSGTYRFKKQWGAEPRQLHWHRWERRPAPQGAGREGSGSALMNYATRLWKHLPLGVANSLGPLVSPSLPW